MNEWRFSTMPLMLATAGGAFILSCHAGGVGFRPTETGRSLTERASGGARTALSQLFKETADVYFHKGVPYQHDVAFQKSIFQTMANAVAPTAHVHLHGTELNEIMPWLWMAIRSDPQNPESYLIAAYWLITNSKRPDLAHEVLHQGKLAAPKNYQFYLDEARIYIEEGRTADAMDELNAAMRFWNDTEDRDKAQARIDKASILMHRALLHEVRGERDKAIADLQTLQADDPSDVSIHERITALRAGTGPSVRARELLDLMLAQDGYAHFECQHGEHKGEHDHNHDN
jgi:tetratricopeptide (TPR) repeat protein